MPSLFMMPAGSLRNGRAGRGRDEEYPMMDILMLVLAASFFAAAIAYAHACERL